MSVVKEYIDQFNDLHKKKVTKNSIVEMINRFKAKHEPKLNEAIARLEKISLKLNGVPTKLKIKNPLKYVEETKVVKAPEPARESKRSLPPVKRKAGNKVTKEISKKSVDDKPLTAMSGFTTADKMPEKAKDLFTLGGEIGKFLGEQQRYRLQIVIDGEKHSSKSELVKQLANAFIDHGFKTALVDYEMGGLHSKDTQAGIKRNVTPANAKKLFVSNEDFPATIQALKGIANKFDVILIDSGSKLNQITNEWLDELRTEYPDTIWVVLMHQNAKGTTKGGSAAGYNAPVIIKTKRPDVTNPLKNFAWAEKNRGNFTNKWYLIAQKKVVTKEPV